MSYLVIGEAMSYIVKPVRQVQGAGQILLRNTSMPTQCQDWYFCPNQIPSLINALSRALADLLSKDGEYGVVEAVSQTRPVESEAD